MRHTTLSSLPRYLPEQPALHVGAAAAAGRLAPPLGVRGRHARERGGGHHARLRVALLVGGGGGVGFVIGRGLLIDQAARCAYDGNS